MVFVKLAAIVIGLGILGACGRQPAPAPASATLQCRTCHPGFYEKWAGSRHGLAMQPFSEALARDWAESGEVVAGGVRYRFREGSVEDGAGRRYPAAYAMGGKNVYYLLTPLDGGRMQVLPIAYDLHKRKWYDVAASGVRPHAGGVAAGALPWTDSAFTFNTSCYSCHVSGLRTNYDAARNSYQTDWAEAGINCETCHGSDPHRARMADLTVQQRNETCAPCHAKMSPLSARYEPGQRFFDHYDLVAWESADFYPDGRDLGENYTYTSWMSSGCARSGKLDCLYCHTSSGRFRQAGEPDTACTGCHAEVAAAGTRHTHHKAARCVDCHMPKTRFANMTRSDHSMRGPTPAATVRYQSPNACNLCHKEKDAAWADRAARAWYGNAYPDTVMEQAALVDAARRQDWTRMPAMVAAVMKTRDAVFAASMLRLLRPAPDDRKRPAYLAKASDPHPLVRAAAVAGLAEDGTEEARGVLAKATRDEYRLVRIRAAAALGSGAPAEATQELLASYNARPDDFAALTNLGNFYLRRQQTADAVQAFERAIRLRPDSVGTLTNASVAYVRANRPADAERLLRQALHYAPRNAAVLFNLGLLLAEMARPAEAESALRNALAADPKLAAAAYNLAVIVAGRDPDEAVSFARMAVAAAPGEAKYRGALAQFEARRLTLPGSSAKRPASGR